eukprot:scaffold404186_cov33-Prasinocladus_malaysianus.AAC.1
MKARFLDGQWLAEASPAGRLRIVQLLRLLTRDSTFRKAFVHSGGVKVKPVADGVGNRMPEMRFRKPRLSQSETHACNRCWPASRSLWHRSISSLTHRARFTLRRSRNVHP